MISPAFNSGTFNSAIKSPFLANLAILPPIATRWPNSNGMVCNTPAKGALTLSEESWNCALS